MIHLLPLPNILAYIAYTATIVLLFADIVIIHKSTLGRKIKNIQVNQRDIRNNENAQCDQAVLNQEKRIHSW